MPQVCSFLGCNPSSTLTFDEGDHSNKSCAESTHTFMFQPGPCNGLLFISSDSVIRCLWLSALISRCIVDEGQKVRGFIMDTKAQSMRTGQA
ncbi:hypothetical protein DPX16_16757 [Anabarilius grahami]|uniref:Uncharacterized protein n=1 Tax=Anabarilius grahami TaxID=495550 RepID=A0A3N0YSF9_ANAGA|nr:hypothetical protein DPX16_16757 [Anabarilius grahami]